MNTPDTRTPTQEAAALMDLILVFEAQKKTLADDKRRVDGALAKAEADLMSIMFANNMTVLGTDRAVADLTTANKPKVTDWGMLYEHITATQGFDLLYRRISGAAFDERIAAGVMVPGVEVAPVTTVKVKPKLR